MAVWGSGHRIWMVMVAETTYQQELTEDQYLIQYPQGCYKLQMFNDYRVN